MSQKQIRVAVALVIRNGQLLVGWRDEKLHQGGCYEFPGGKIEANETGIDAVKREIQEEAGIEIEVIKLFHELVFDYSDRIVHLFFYLCRQKSLNSISTGWQWRDVDHLSQVVFPAANAPVLARLNWQRHLAISPDWLTMKDQQPRAEVELCYLRVAVGYVEQAIHMLQQQHPQIKLILQHDAYLTLNKAQQQQIFAVHLNGRQLQAMQDLTQFKHKNVIAACHLLQDVEKANMLGCDAILLSPVQPTATHPDQAALGWEKFNLMTRQAHMPVYALGGVQITDLALAQQYGAYGVAGIGDFWQSNKK